MAQRGEVWMRWLGLAVAGLLVWEGIDLFVGQRAGPERLVNQVWLERWPRDGRDMIWHFVAVESEGRRVGNLGRSSRWRVASDNFVWNRTGDRLQGRFPQNDCHLNLQARTWKCAGEAPKPFELCLELKSGGQVFKYYSRNDWALRPHGPLHEEIAGLVPDLQAAAADAPTATWAADENDAPAVTGTCAALGPAATE